ncbi:nucleoside hydrolase [Eubacteriales bacterium OttesenSCG-928-N13]|nr:nucleoside hydrolase [Eubacteriales bacterium OttesenSCG-928-N13]
MVLDTDTYNEVDDQFALAYALLSPETLNVQAIYAAPFLNTRSTSAADGMEKSHAEILRLLDVMNRDLPVFKGSTGFLPASDTPVDSPAARDLVQRALAMPDDELLYVVAIGAITNVASALLMEPRIAHKIVIVWLGGNAPGYPSAKEFNLDQDKHAARVVFDCGAPLTLIPCFGVTSHLLASVPELQAHIGGKNTLCDALIELFAAYEHSHPNWSKEIWDIGAIAYLIQPDWMPSILMHSPLITDDAHWGHDETRHLIRIAYFCKRNMVFDDLYQKLSSL